MNISVMITVFLNKMRYAILKYTYTKPKFRTKLTFDLFNLRKVWLKHVIFSVYRNNGRKNSKIRSYALSSIAIKMNAVFFDLTGLLWFTFKFGLLCSKK